jgi:GT2 family glycosyltransferase
MHLKEPIASVIICCYKKFDNLANNIKSIARQTYQNIEVIVSDDGSDNYSHEAVDSILKENLKCPYTILRNESNVGTVRNFSRAIGFSSGKYIIPLAQDDCFESSTAVEVIVSFFETNNSDFVTSKRKGRSTGKILPAESDIVFFGQSKQMLLNRLFISNFISGSCLCYRKSSFEKVGGFDTDMVLVEDYPFVLKSLLNDYAIDFLDEITIAYGEAGVSNGTISGQIKTDYYAVMDKYIIPHLDMVENKTVRDYIKRKYSIYRDDSRLKKLFVSIKYLNITINNLKARFIYKQERDVYYINLLKRSVSHS